jgi:hypothetical protein
MSDHRDILKQQLKLLGLFCLAGLAIYAIVLWTLSIL